MINSLFAATFSAVETLCCGFLFLLSVTEFYLDGRACVGRRHPSFTPPYLEDTWWPAGVSRTQRCRAATSGGSQTKRRVETYCAKVCARGRGRVRSGSGRGRFPSYQGDAWQRKQVNESHPHLHLWWCWVERSLMSGRGGGERKHGDMSSFTISSVLLVLSTPQLQKITKL